MHYSDRCGPSSLRLYLRTVKFRIISVLELIKEKYKELKSRYEKLEKENKLNDVTRNYLQSSLHQIENALATVYGTDWLISKRLVSVALF